MSMNRAYYLDTAQIWKTWYYHMLIGLMIRKSVEYEMWIQGKSNAMVVMITMIIWVSFLSNLFIRLHLRAMCVNSNPLQLCAVVSMLFYLIRNPFIRCLFVFCFEPRAHTPLWLSLFILVVSRLDNIFILNNFSEFCSIYKWFPSVCFELFVGQQKKKIWTQLMVCCLVCGWEHVLFARIVNKI